MRWAQAVLTFAAASTGCTFDPSGVAVDASAAGTDRSPAIDAVPGPDATAPVPVLYAGPLESLFVVDPEDFTSTFVADFTRASDSTPIDLEELATDSLGRTIALDVGSNALFLLDISTGVCTEMAPLPSDHGQTFRGFTVGYPEGIETFYLGSNDGLLFTIDPGTGALSEIGSYGGGLQTAGDLAWLPGTGLILGGRLSGVGKLAVVDTDTAQATIIGDTPESLLGLGVIGTRVFGFSNDIAYEIDPATGDALRSMDVPNVPYWALAAP